MSDSFRRGFIYLQNNAGANWAGLLGAGFGEGRAEYVDTVANEISDLEDSINAFFGSAKSPKQLKGDVAEFWHAKTFNVNAATNKSTNRAFVDRSTEFGSVDVSSNFGEDFGLKYYATGADSAKQQAASVFQRFKEYQADGGKDNLQKYLSDRKYTNEDVLNDPIYSGQIRVIPKDQMNEAIEWLQRKIAKEELTRPEQVKRYQDTLALLRDRIADKEGNESIPLSKEDAERLASLAKKGIFKAEEFDVSAPELLEMEWLVKESLKAGFSAALVSLVLKTGPEIFKAIDYLIKDGEVDREKFRKIGFAALTGSAEGFIRGSVSAAIMACCKSGAMGEALKEINPGVLGTIVAVTMNTMKNAYQVALGKKSRTELTTELIRDMFVSSSSLLLGYVSQSILHTMPVLGYLLGSFVGSVVGSFVYDTGYRAVMSFCTETGVTMFGLVEQDYKLPKDIISELGLETFEYESFEADSFEPESFAFDTFEAESIQPDTLGITMLRRGVIGITKIGYVS